MTQRLEPFFFQKKYDLQELNFLKILTQTISPFLVWLKELKFFLEYDSKNWTFYLNTTHRIEPFCEIWLKELNFFEYDSKNWTLFLDDSKKWTLFFLLNMTQRIEQIFLNMRQRIEPFFFPWIWRKELNSFFECDSKSWIFFERDSKNLFIFFFEKMRLWEMNLFQYDSKNWIWLKWLNFYFPNMTQRIEPSFSIWLKELNPFLNKTHRIEPFFLNMIHRIEPSFQKWLKKLNFLSEKELNPFLENMTQRFEPLFQEKLKELKLFLNQRIEPLFSDMTQRIEPSFLNMSQWIELFFSLRLKKMSPLIKVCFKELNIFCMTQRLERFFFLFDVTQRIEPSFLHNSKTWAFLTWLKLLVLFFDWIFFFSSALELNHWRCGRPGLTVYHCIPLKKTIGPFFFLVWLKELNLFFVWLKELNFFEYDTKNWTLFFFNTTHRIEPFF